METDEDDKVLRLLADGEDMDYSLWPDLFSRLIPRLEKIVREDFPVPVVPRPQPMLASSQPIPSSPPLPASQQPSLVTDTSSQNSVGESTNKENAPPEGVSTSTGSTDSLPPQIISLLNSITKTLQTLFSKHPPHTIQRLAELILHPRQHYKSLYNYLHAVDRVVHVTSGAHVFPLPPAVPDASAASVLSNGTSATDPLSISWGKPTSTAQSTLGSDESLGGALLTPILWLSNKNGNSHVSDMEGEVRTESTETIEGPNGPGGIETVSVSVNGISSATAATTALSNSIDNGTTSLRAEGGVTQGELLRQEQRAGVVPAAQLANHGRGDADGVGEDDETPHARGPEEIGMEDMGPQSSGNGTERSGPGMTMQGIDVEAAVGRRAEDSESMEEDAKEKPSTPKREAEEGLGSDEKRLKEDRTEELKEGEIKKEETKEVEMVDVDGRAEDEKKVGESGENVGSDAIDTSAV